jgi:hypothetical protein
MANKFAHPRCRMGSGGVLPGISSSKKWQCPEVLKIRLGFSLGGGDRPPTSRSVCHSRPLGGNYNIREICKPKRR